MSDEVPASIETFDDDGESWRLDGPYSMGILGVTDQPCGSGALQTDASLAAGINPQSLYYGSHDVDPWTTAFADSKSTLPDQPLSSAISEEPVPPSDTKQESQASVAREILLKHFTEIDFHGFRKGKAQEIVTQALSRLKGKALQASSDSDTSKSGIFEVYRDLCGRTNDQKEGASIVRKNSTLPPYAINTRFGRRSPRATRADKAGQ